MNTVSRPSQTRTAPAIFFVGLEGLEPSRLPAPDPKYGVPTNSTTSPEVPRTESSRRGYDDKNVVCSVKGIRTPDLELRPT